MGDIFSGLESMGFQGLSSVKLYEEEKKENKKQTEEEKKPEFVEADFVFEKKMQCPVCDKEFKAKTVKTGKPRLIGSDTDLRPKYAGIDSIKYDAIVCPHCGYAALSRFFSYMTSTQAKLIQQNVSSTFKGLPNQGDTLSYMDAINRHKLALLNTVIKKAKISERAYTCLKIAWLYRGMEENLVPETPNVDLIRKECKKNEKEMINNAFEGFVVSRSKEDFPVCGMDEATLDYLIAVLASKVDKKDVALKLLSAVVVSRTANAKLKEKARDMRDSLKNK